MDDQHGILIDTINEFRRALVRGSDREEANKLLGQLIDFMRMHIWNEDHLLEQYGFPGLVEHRAEHRILLSQMQESARKAQYSGNVPMCSLLESLRERFQEHMGSVDLEYGSWINERGVY